MISWDSDDLRVRRDNRWMARYRLLQSWYRETRLRLPPGLSTRRRSLPVGSMIAHESLDERPGANFLSDSVFEYVGRRVPHILTEGGTVNADRVYRNMLSSQPLCFNLFGFLRDHPRAFRDALVPLLDLDIADIELTEVEWAPPAAEHLGDRTAFDAFVRYRTGDGRRGFLGIETKYTEKFSPEPYDRSSYRRLTDDGSNGFVDGASDRLKRPRTNQLWRNALLALSLRQSADFDEGYCIVVHCAEDAGLAAAISAFHDERDVPGSLVRNVTFESLVAALAENADVANWAAEFSTRYLDLGPVSHVR